MPPGGVKEDFLTDLVNATSLAFDAYGVLHVSSRYDGAVYRVRADRSVEAVASDLGVACGIAFGADGTLFVGDRGGTVFRVGAAQRVTPFATLPASMAAFHLAVGPEDCLYVTAPTFGTYDTVYRIDRIGRRDASCRRSSAGRRAWPSTRPGTCTWSTPWPAARAVSRARGPPRELVLSAPALVGVALDPSGGLVVSSNDTAYRLDVPVKPFPVFQHESVMKAGAPLRLPASAGLVIHVADVSDQVGREYSRGQ